MPVAPRFAPDQAIDEDQCRGEQAEEERADWQQRDRAGEDDDDQDRAEPRPAGDPDHVGRGERVGQRSLQDRPSDPQGGADDERLDGARQAQGLDDLLVGAAAPAAEDDVDHFAEGDLDRAQRQRSDGGGDEGDDERREDERAAGQGASVLQIDAPHFADRPRDVGARLQQ